MEDQRQQASVQERIAAGALQTSYGWRAVTRLLLGDDIG